MIVIDNIRYSINTTKTTASVLSLESSSISDIIIPQYIEYLNELYIITTIGRNAFSDRPVVSVNLPNTIGKIQDNAFANCSLLTQINLPETIKIIEHNALCSIKIIEHNAFSFCSNLEYITLPSLITSLNANTFQGCTKLRYIEIPELVSNIGSNAFSGCLSLRKIILPKSLFTYGSNIFDECSSLTDVVYNGLVFFNPSQPVITNAYIYENRNITNLSSKFTNINFIIDVNKIKYGVNAITKNATILYVDKSLQECIFLNELDDYRVTSISEYAFIQCNIVSINIPSAITIINKYAFLNCNLLKKVFLPRSITLIDDYVFDGCVLLSDVIFEGELTSIGAICSVDRKITTAYTVSGPSMNDILAPYFTNITENIYIDFPNISGINYRINIYENFASIVSMVNYDDATEPALIDTIVFNDINYTVTTIERAAFENGKFVSIDLPDTITLIQEYAFYNCPYLVSVRLPKSLRVIERAAFCFNYSLENIIFYDSITTISADAFKSTGIEYLELPDSIRLIDANAFNSSKLRYVKLPNNLDSISFFTFLGCPLEIIEFPSSVDSIGGDAFAGINLSSKIYFNGQIPQINANGFSLTIGSNTTAYIYDYYSNKKNELLSYFTNVNVVSRNSISNIHRIGDILYNIYELYKYAEILLYFGRRTGLEIPA